ncbi:MAG: PorP/SprF family type IX secretion system membrane protein [Bacteroidales bacterium]|nr:PorP/SprF family type IX secretion system membrane protein [Bacteroidales bacterium]
MKLLVKTVLIILFISSNLNLFSQNLYNYSLFNHNPEIYNPSSIVSDDLASFFLTSRLQWAGFEGFPKYNALGAAYSISPKMALGFSLFNSTHGVINNLKAKVSYAYKINFSKNHFMKMGLSLGVVNDNLFFSQLEYVDLTDNAILPDNYNKISVTSAFGISYQLKGFEAQLILPQLYEYNEINLYGIGVFSYSFRANQVLSIKPSVLVRNTEINKIQADAVLNMQWRKKIWIQMGARSNGSIIFGIGNQTIGYAYESPTNNISGVSVGTHEILLKFRIKPTKYCPAYL